MDLQIGNLAVVEEGKRGGFFRAWLLELGGFDPLQANRVRAALLGVPLSRQRKAEKGKRPRS
jgi:hypothetical protein